MCLNFLIGILQKALEPAMHDFGPFARRSQATASAIPNQRSASFPNVQLYEALGLNPFRVDRKKRRPIPGFSETARSAAGAFISNLETATLSPEPSEPYPA
jgi:hypothetical protein